MFTRSKTAAFLALNVAGILAQPIPSLRPPQAPPPAPPEVTVPFEAAPGGGLRAAANVYSIGDPTPEEQLYLELINRARRNPQGEALLLATTTDMTVLSDYNAWGVDLVLMQDQFAELTTAQPLAFNAKLTAAARKHTADMFENVFQGHTGSNGSVLPERIAAEGYSYSRIGENVFSYANSVFHGHAGFEVDWGPGVGGMQTPAGHRNSIHNPSFREVGIGVTLGVNERTGENPVGPQLVTQEFGAGLIQVPFVTGVAYYDLNGNNFYDMGEGIGGLKVTVSGTAMEGVTALSGGYAVPVAGNGTYTVTFSGGGFPGTQQTAVVASNANVKIDFIPSYHAPQVTGSLTPAIGRANTYNISPVNGSSAYEWRVFQKIPARMEGAENGTSNFEIVQTGSYAAVQSTTTKSGNLAFHLVHPEVAPRSQYVTLKPTYLIQEGSTLTFASRLGWATPDQHAVVQVSTDNGSTWQAVYNQDGTAGQGEASFQDRSIDLSEFVGKSIRVRFVYEFNSGSFFSQEDIGVGWIFDDIQLVNAEEAVNEEVNSTAGTAFQFNPSAEGNFVLQARARTGHTFLEWGPQRSVTAVESTGSPEVRLGEITLVAGTVQIEIQLEGGTASTFAVESKARLEDSWSAMPATISAVSDTQFRAVVAAAGEHRFFRVQAN